MNVRVLQGDVRERLAELPSDWFDCIVTSPPYWGLRDYGVTGQIGLESTLGEHLAVMVDVFREVRRVLKPHGTCWLNYGDCYAAVPNGKSAAAYKADSSDDRTFRDKPFSTVGAIYDPAGGARGGGSRGSNKGNTGGITDGRPVAGGTLKPKDLCMISNRLAIALQEDGWWVRSEIIWHKPNPMPESVTDRPTSSHEKIWLLTKSERYWYDAGAIAEPAIYSGLANQDASGFKDPRSFNGKHKDGYRTDKQRGHSRRHVGFNERWDAMGKAEQCSGQRNARNVWTIASRPYSEAHFATFPPELAERCIKAGCPIGGHVLDPFGGAGTTALVAHRLHRSCTLIELNPNYVKIARNRLADDAGMFAQVAAE